MHALLPLRQGTHQSNPNPQGGNASMNDEDRFPSTGKKAWLCKPFLVAWIALWACLPACGGGGGGSSGQAAQPPPPPPPPVNPVAATSMNWTSPQFFTDDTPLDPTKDLELFEIYVKQDSSFGTVDHPVATVWPSTNSFDFQTVDPPLSKGVTYYASVRAVTPEGEKSDFSVSGPFFLPN
jgi:hypothetical protein